MSTAQFLKLGLAIVLVFLVVRYVTVTFFCQSSPLKAGSEPFTELEQAFAKASASAAAASAPAAASVDTDLLPKNPGKGEDFSEFAPKAVAGQNFLDAAKFIGVDTVGQTLKNANYQLRAEIPNPRKQVSIWSQSTIEPDMLRRPLE